MAFSNGELTAEEFHSRIVQAGLASLVPEMATLLPDRKRQDMLLNVHRSTYLNDSAPTHDGYVVVLPHLPPLVRQPSLTVHDWHYFGKKGQPRVDFCPRPSMT